MQTPLVSIIIVNWNSKNFLKTCLSSLYEQTYDNYEIIIVDNASTDNSLESITDDFPQVKIIRNEKNVGFAAGNNIGITHSTGDLIAMVNPDVIVQKEWLSKLVAVLCSSDRIGGVTGKMFYLQNNLKTDKVFCTWSKINQFSVNPYNFRDNEPSSEVDYLSGAAMLVKKEIIDKVGFLDPDYFLFFDETDWCARMIRADYDLVYVPDAFVWHAVSATISQTEKKIYYMERSKIRFAIKNFDFSYLAIFYCILFIESFYILIRDVAKRNLVRTKIRFKAISWNIHNIKNILKKRRNDMAFLSKSKKPKSYNRSLPLRRYKTGSDLI